MAEETIPRGRCFAAGGISCQFAQPQYAGEDCSLGLDRQEAMEEVRFVESMGIGRVTAFRLVRKRFWQEVESF
jgi:hypothetical protein